MNQKEKAKHNRLMKTYGITLEEFNKKFEEQGNVCACCGKLYPRMCQDHIHVLGFKKMNPTDKRKYLRGICCFQCNTSFKCFEKTKDGKRNREHLEGVYKYFMKYCLKGEA